MYTGTPPRVLSPLTTMVLLLLVTGNLKASSIEHFVQFNKIGQIMDQDQGLDIVVEELQSQG